MSSPSDSDTDTILCGLRLAQIDDDVDYSVSRRATLDQILATLRADLHLPDTQEIKLFMMRGGNKMRVIFPRLLLNGDLVHVEVEETSNAQNGHGLGASPTSSKEGKQGSGSHQRHNEAIEKVSVVTNSWKTPQDGRKGLPGNMNKRKVSPSDLHDKLHNKLSTTKTLKKIQKSDVSTFKSADVEKPPTVRELEAYKIGNRSDLQPGKALETHWRNRLLKYEWKTDHFRLYLQNACGVATDSKTWGKTMDFVAALLRNDTPIRASTSKFHPNAFQLNEDVWSWTRQAPPTGLASSATVKLKHAAQKLHNYQVTLLQDIISHHEKESDTTDDEGDSFTRCE